MSNFGQTLFGSSGFIRWTLSPFLLLFAVLMPLLVESRTPSSIAVLAGLELMCLALLAGFWLPARIGHWAFRILAGLVFVAYAAYLGDALLRPDGATPFNALLGFAIVGLPSLWFAWRGRFTLHPAPSSEELAAERQADEAQILQPDWEFYERHLQRPVPVAMRELYADRSLVTACGLKGLGGNDISTFNPLQEQALLETRDQLGFDIVAFAWSDCGDPIYLRPGPSEPDTVYLTYHDEDKTKVFAESVAVMVEKLRAANRSGEHA